MDFSLRLVLVVGNWSGFVNLDQLYCKYPAPSGHLKKSCRRFQNMMFSSPVS